VVDAAPVALAADVVDEVAAVTGAVALDVGVAAGADAALDEVADGLAVEPQPATPNAASAAINAGDDRTATLSRTPG
jgi:hypothetical protein